VDLTGLLFKKMRSLQLVDHAAGGLASERRKAHPRRQPRRKYKDKRSFRQLKKCQKKGDHYQYITFPYNIRPEKAKSMLPFKLVALPLSSTCRENILKANPNPTGTPHKIN
jgi:hypothetical protein